jgi:O-succinylbenzoate synthase
VAEASGLPVVVSSAVETSVGIAAGLALAAALPELPYACGLATVSLLKGDVVADSLVARGGCIAVARPEPVPALLDRWRLEGEEAEQVIARWNEAQAVLDGLVTA